MVDCFTIKESAALMQQLKACIVPDTGMLHIASSTDVPIIGLYSVTNPSETGPFPGRKKNVAIVRNSMTEMTADIVFHAVEPFLIEPTSVV